jgi:hypothetical protein
MKSKFYALAGLRLRVDSETPIADSDLYREFYSPEGDHDILIRVAEGKLPARPEKPFSVSPLRAFYHEEGDVSLFSSYPTAVGDRPFACRRGTGDEILLTVDSPDGLWDAMLFYALNLPELTARRGLFLLHSSFVIFRGEAILFCAGKGVGKSTQAALWERCRGAAVVNGDRSLLQWENGVLTAHGTPYCGSSQIALNRSAPVKAVVLLSQGSENMLDRCDAKRAFPLLLAQLSFEQYQKEMAVDFALSLCSGASLYEMSCLPEESAVALLEESLWKQ